MQVYLTLDGKGLQKMAYQVARERFHHNPFQASFHDGVGAATTIHRYLGQGFVQRHDSMAHATDPYRLTQGLIESAAQHYCHVLNQVVPTSVKVPCGPQGYIEQSVPGYLADHVIKEAVAGVHVVVALAIEVDRDRDVSLVCFSL
jgi:hypothetical protein